MAKTKKNHRNDRHVPEPIRVVDLEAAARDLVRRGLASQAILGYTLTSRRHNTRQEAAA